MTRTPWLYWLKRGGLSGLPTSLDGVPVRVIVTGKIEALHHRPGHNAGPGGGGGIDRTARFDRPVPIGVSTGHPDITAGTIGARVTDGTDVYALSNNHVYAAQNAASIGDQVIQPGAIDGGSSPGDDIGTLAAFEPIVFGGADNMIDAAIALTSIGEIDNGTPSDGYGVPSSTTVLASVGMDVKKYGRTTGESHSSISAINATVNVGYDVGTARFVQQIVVSGGSFSSGGDSGSLIVTENGNNPVGLLYAGSQTATIANPIDAVLARFGVTIDDGSGVTPPSDTEDPVVTVLAPNGGEDWTSGSSQAITWTATDDIGVTSVDLSYSIDGGSFIPIATGETNDGSYSWTVPNTLSTMARVRVIAHDLVTKSGQDDSDAVFEISEASPPPPGGDVTVTDVSPESVAAGDAKIVTISGSGFEGGGGVSVTFESGRGPTPIVSAITVAGDGEISTTITAPSGGPRGTRDWVVRVTVGGSSGTCACFSVVR